MMGNDKNTALRQASLETSQTSENSLITPEQSLGDTAREEDMQMLPSQEPVPDQVSQSPVGPLRDSRRKQKFRIRLKLDVVSDRLHLIL